MRPFVLIGAAAAVTVLVPAVGLALIVALMARISLTWGHA